MLKFRTHGKWILAGEHTVLRGGKALVFPVESRYLDFSVEPAPDLKLEFEKENSDLEMAFWGVLERALQSLGVERKDIQGHLYLESNIPVGAGMGASATLCVSLAKWFTDLGFLKKEEQYNFSKNLENLFHGESSGVDVAVALNHKGLIFQKPDRMETFEPNWKPHFYLSYCGKRGVTADCIRRVQDFIKVNPTEGIEVDQNMLLAVEMATDSLRASGELKKLAQAIELACQCFQRWGLVSKDLEEHMIFLKKHGAVAAKPTGSGDGGFVLSLWEGAPDGDWGAEALVRA